MVIFADDKIKSIITNRLRSSWPSGLYGSNQDGQLQSDGSYEYTLKGNPFGDNIDPSRSAVMQLLFCQLLADLKIAGWRLFNCTKDLSQPTPNSARSTLFFRRVAGDVPNEPDICSVSSAGTGESSNVLRFINMKKEIVSDLASNVEPSGTCRLISSAKKGLYEVMVDETMWGDCETLYSRRVIIKVSE